MFTDPSTSIRIRLQLLGILMFWMSGCQLSHSQLSRVSEIQPSDSAVKADTIEPQIQQASFIQEVEIEQLTEKSSRRKFGANNNSNVESEPTLEESVGSLEIFEGLALAINPAIQKVEAEIRALNGKCLQVGLAPNPSAGVFGEDINEAGSAGRYGVYYSQPIVRSNRLSLARQKVCAEIQSKEVELAELQQRLITDVRLRFYELVVANAKAEVADQLYTIADNGVDATRQLVEAKEAAATSLIQSEIEFEKAKLNLKRVDNEVLAATQKLAGLLGESELPFDQISGSLEQLETLHAEHFDELLTRSPEIAKMYAEVDIAKRNLRHQCSLRIPDITWQAGLAYDFGSDTVVPNFQIGVPIQKNNCNQGAIAQARHEVTARERAAEQKALDLRQRLVVAYQVYRDATLQVEAIRDGIMPKASATLKQLSFGYEQGEVGFLQLLTAQRTYFQLNLEYVQQLQVLWRQRVLIEGMLLQNNFGQMTVGR